MKLPRGRRRGLTAFETFMSDLGFDLRRVDQNAAETIRNEWIDTYVPSSFQRDERSLRNWFYWHPFSFKVVRHEEGDVARNHFRKSMANLRYVWFSRRSLGVYECKSVPTDVSADLTSQIREISGTLADSVWTGEGYSWTFTATHEEEWGLGPYFSMKKWRT